MYSTNLALYSLEIHMASLITRNPLYLSKAYKKESAFVCYST